jgi:hypothetical protein
LRAYEIEELNHFQMCEMLVVDDEFIYHVVSPLSMYGKLMSVCFFNYSLCADLGTEPAVLKQQDMQILLALVLATATISSSLIG